MLFAGSCLADDSPRKRLADEALTGAAAVDSRLDALTCHIANLYSEGRIDARTYAHLHAMRSEAARAVTIWLHSGRGEYEARAALVILESAVPQ